MSENIEQHPKVESQTTTERVSIYCESDDKLRWTSEADAAGYSSRSEYLFELIQEPRRYREKGFLSREQKQDEINRLEAGINRLKNELEDTESQNRAVVHAVENPELAKQVLSTKFQSLQEIVEAVLNQNAVTVNARDLVERALFQLAQIEEAEYSRGHGWRLLED